MILLFIIFNPVSNGDKLFFECAGGNKVVEYVVRGWRKIDKVLQVPWTEYGKA